METTVEKVRRIVKDHLCLDDRPGDDVTFKDLNADSLDEVELLMQLEEEFGVQLNDADMDTYNTVKRMADHIDNDCVNGGGC